MSTVDVPQTFGALLIGGLFAAVYDKRSFVRHANRLNAVIDSLIRYTLETGLLTWCVTPFYDECLVLLTVSSVREQ